jgi:hypothetical protein
MAITISGSGGITYPDGSTANTGGNITLTGALTLPSGNTAQRPSGANGSIRFNTSNNVIESYTGGSWNPIVGYSVTFLLVAGGGGGGSYAGGGGAGGLVLSGTSVTPGTSYVITVGAGGSAGLATPGTQGGNGGNSIFTGVATAIGGGGGGTSVYSSG